MACITAAMIEPSSVQSGIGCSSGVCDVLMVWVFKMVNRPLIALARVLGLRDIVVQDIPALAAGTNILLQPLAESAALFHLASVSIRG